MNSAFYEIDDNFTPIFNTAVALIKARGNHVIVSILEKSNYSIANTDFDNWNGGTYEYTVNVNLPVKVYSSIPQHEVLNYEKIIAEALNETMKGDENNSFNIQLCPYFSKLDIEWNTIGNDKTKSQLKYDIETVRGIMISVSTGGAQIQEEDTRYKRLNANIKSLLSKLQIDYKNNFDSLWDWFGKWKAEFKTYQERRNYINSIFNPVLSLFEEDQCIISSDTIVNLDEWDRIKRTSIRIKRDSSLAINEEDFQSIGHLCRETIISLAQVVYNKNIHGCADDKGIAIGDTDAVRMLGNYIMSTLQGASNEELKSYVKNTNKLANVLTHKRTATKRDMLLAMSATFALINFIGVLENKL